MLEGSVITSHECANFGLDLQGKREVGPREVPIFFLFVITLFCFLLVMKNNLAQSSNVKPCQ